MNKQIDVGIVNFNGGDCLLKCIESILSMSGARVNVYVLDNMSSDDSIDLAEKKFPECTFIRSKINLGYARGCNCLLRSFTSDVVAVCNMDLEFPVDWAANIINCFSNYPDASSVASLVIQKDTNEVYASDIHFFWDLHPICVSERDSSEKDHQVFGAYGAVMAFRKQVFEKIGYFDDDYFLFFEETEFFLRMNINKLKVILCPSARIFHHRSISTVRYSTKKLYYTERNRIWTAFKYLPLWYFPVLFPLSILRLYVMSKNGVPQKDGLGKNVRTSEILSTLFKAWLCSFSKLNREWKKRKLIWKKTDMTPIYALSIISKYNLKISQLRVK
jgi:GT2 family glycosyltransferase